MSSILAIAPFVFGVGLILFVLALTMTTRPVKSEDVSVSTAITGLSGVIAMVLSSSVWLITLMLQALAG